MRDARTAIALCVVSFVVVAIAMPSSSQARPSQFALMSACMDANRQIPELIELAPHGTGRINRTKAWFGEVSDSIRTLLQWGSTTDQKDGLSVETRAAIKVDVQHMFLYFDLFTIMETDGEAIKKVMPDKLDEPATYIARLKTLKKAFVDPVCTRVLR